MVPWRSQPFSGLAANCTASAAVSSMTPPPHITQTHACTVVRNHTRYMQFLRKRTNTNPKRGPFHYRAPSRILWRTVRHTRMDSLLLCGCSDCRPPFGREGKSATDASYRTNERLHHPHDTHSPTTLPGARPRVHAQIRGMLPHKTFRGAQALNRLTTFEGIPAPYDTKKRVVVPQALKILRLKPGRRFCTLGRLAHEVGWGHRELVQRLEAKRKVRAASRRVAPLHAGLPVCFALPSCLLAMTTERACGPCVCVCMCSAVPMLFHLGLH